MALKVALQMDPVEAISIEADSTFRIGIEAEARGHSLFYYTPDRLFYREGRVLARGWPLSLRRVKGDHFTLGPETEVDLAEMDVVWLRQDPPFDMGYITTTHLLDMVRPGTLVVNDPFWVRNFPEKLLVLKFPELTPPTLVARDLGTIRAFKAVHGDIILKPLYGNGGAGVFRLDPNDRNLASLHELFTGISREPMIAQKYVPAVVKGDKRIILVDGEAVKVLDFDDCGFSWHLYDAATAVSFFEHEPQVPELMAAWAEGYRRHSRHCVELLTLAGRFWKWRMQGGAIELAAQANARLAAGERPDMVLATDMVNLPA